MFETDSELTELQRILDASATSAGPHLRSVISDERRLDAKQLCDRLQGMRLLVVASVTADGRPLTGPVDGYLIHGCFYFSSARNSVKMAHFASRPAVSATHLPGEELAVTVHGSIELFEVSDPEHPELRRAMLDHYLPKQGPDFEHWLEEANPVGARIVAERMFTFKLDG